MFFKNILLECERIGFIIILKRHNLSPMFWIAVRVTVSIRET